MTDLERVGDYSENIVEYAMKLESSGGKFSEDARKEIGDLRSLIEELYEKIMEAYVNVDREALGEAMIIEDKIDDFTSKMADEHIRRLNSGICHPDAGAEYLSLASDAERIADHFVNVGKAIKDYSRKQKRPATANVES